MLFGLIVGYVLAMIMGKVDFTGVSGMDIIAFPQIFPYTPTFNLDAIISVTLIFLVSATETIGDTSALTSPRTGVITVNTRTDILDNKRNGVFCRVSSYVFVSNFFQKNEVLKEFVVRINRRFTQRRNHFVVGSVTAFEKCDGNRATPAQKGVAVG